MFCLARRISGRGSYFGGDSSTDPHVGCDGASADRSAPQRELEASPLPLLSASAQISHTVLECASCLLPGWLGKF